MKKWLGGIGAAIAAAAPLTLIIAAALILALIGGMMAAVSGGLGALSGHQANENESGQCMADDGGGTGTPTTASQKDYVRDTIGIAKTLDVSEKGQIVAVMVMFQESGIQSYANTGENRFNYPIGDGTSRSTDWWLDTAKLSLEYPHDATGKDADSVGLYQQRASAGWGDGGGYKAETSNDHGRKAVERLLDPKWSAQAFFGGEGGPDNRGLRDVSGWESMAPTVAAQTVQGSAFPDAYAKWESKARALVSENSDAPAVPLVGSGDSGDSGNSEDSDDSGESEDSGSSDEESGDSDSSGGNTQLPMKEGTYSLTSPYGPRPDRPVAAASDFHQGQDFAAPLGTPIYAAADGTVAAAGPTEGYGQWVVLDHQVDGKKWSTTYGHITASSIKVEKGDKVSAGEQIAGVGSEGYSTGPHLHFEVWDGGILPWGSGGKHVNPMDWVEGDHVATAGEGGGVDCDNAGGENNAGSAAEGTAKDVIDAAKTQIGVPYSWGGGSLEGPSEGFDQGAGINGFDCSSLVRYAVYHGTGKTYELPRVATDQWNATKKNTVSWDEMEPGDLMFWSRGGGDMYHVAIYLGDGQMIEAPRTGMDVQITDARKDNFAGATRPDYKSESS